MVIAAATAEVVVVVIVMVVVVIVVVIAAAVVVIAAVIVMVVAVVIVIADHVAVMIADHVQIIVVMTTVHATMHLAKSVHHVMNHKVAVVVISSSIDQQLTFIRVVMETSPPFFVGELCLRLVCAMPLRSTSSRMASLAPLHQLRRVPIV
jgi:hypothetical protein